MLTTEQQTEIEELRNNRSESRRAVSEGLEEILYQPVKVLDHGFVRVIDYMGNDSSIVQAARVSYGKGTKKISEDRGLINYLMRHRHTTPFEMCEIKFHIKLPIFVARQWIRHRTANVNEYSARYSILDKEFYIPEPQHLAAQSSMNRQGRGDILEGDEAKRALEILKGDSEQVYEHYIEMLNEDDGRAIDESRKGLARELARMNLGLNYYTQWYWKVNLHNLLHFLSLRADSHAQYEIRAYADVMLDMVRKWVPLTYDAFMDYRMNSVNLSGKAFQVICDMINQKRVDASANGLSKREWQELVDILNNFGIKTAE